MERILQGGMERGYGTGVWNGCGPGACSGPPILTCPHIYIMICIYDDSTWHANRLTICSANVTVPENRAKMFFQHLWCLHDSCLGTLRVMSERHSYTESSLSCHCSKNSLWDSSACQQYAWIPNKACTWYHLVNCLPAEFDIFPKRL